MSVQQPVRGGTPMREWCLGYVTENKLPSSNILKVTPLGITPLMQGELSDNPEEEVIETLDARGNPIKSTLKTGTSIEVDWWPTDSVIVDAPYVRRGTRVQLYRYADTKQVYWRDLNFDKALKRGERHRIAISATAHVDRGASGLYDDHYVLDINGPGGLIALTTSEANGEVAGYSLTMDARLGRLYFGDNQDNYYRLDTKNRILEVHNANGTRMEINLENMFLEGHDTITTTFKKLIENISETIERNAGKTIYDKAAEEITLEAPKINLVGQIYMKGPVTQMDGGQGYGTDFKFIGSGKWTGDMTITGTWKINGVDCSGHDHDETGTRTKAPNKS